MFYSTALIYAARKGYLEIVQELLSHNGIDVNVQGIIFPSFK